MFEAWKALERRGLKKHGFYGFLRGFFSVILLFLWDCSKRGGGVGLCSMFPVPRLTN